MGKKMDKVKKLFGKSSKSQPQQQTQKKKVETQALEGTPEEKKAIAGLTAMKDEVQKWGKSVGPSVYTDLINRKEKLSMLAGGSVEAMQAKESLDKAVQEVSDKIGARQNKQMEYADIISEERKTPLETLIKKVKGMNGQDVTPEDVDPNATTPKKTLMQKIKDKVKEKAEEAFDGWRAGIDTVTGLLAGTCDLTGDVSGIAGDSMDVSDVTTVMKEITDKDTGGAGITGAAAAGVSSLVKTFKFLKDMVSEARTDFCADGEVVRDHQERWKLARGYIRDLVEIIGGFKDAFGPISKMIPFFNSIAGLCQSGVVMALDVVDVIDTSVHIEKMRRERNRIYDRIQAKKAKYSRAETRDAAAEEAYTIESKRFRSRSRDVDAKRRALMKIVFEKENARAANGGAKIAEVSAKGLRSKNDSVYRNVQYGLGARIQAKSKATPEEKSEKRQLEALEMMQEFRTVDKAHKKMVKTLGHNIESIVKGGVAIVADGLKLAGEVANASVVGAIGGVGLMTGGLATGIGLSAYEKVRDVGSLAYSGIQRLTGTKKNKKTTREDMAISMIDKMEEIANTPAVWGATGFEDDMKLRDTANHKAVVRQGRNVEHLHKVLRGGLDAKMSDLIRSRDKADLKGKIAECFGQD